MHKHTQRSSIDHQPSYKRTKLSRGPQVDLEHANRMRTNWFVPGAVDAEFWEFMADAGPQLVGKGGLSFIFLWPIRAGVVGRPGKTSRRVEGEYDVALKERKNPSVLVSTGKRTTLANAPPLKSDNSAPQFQIHYFP